MIGFEADGRGGWSEVVCEVEQPRYPPPRDAARPIPRHPIHPLPPCSTSDSREAARSRGAEAGGEAREEAAEAAGAAGAAEAAAAEAAAAEAAAAEEATAAEEGEAAVGEEAGGAWGWWPSTRFVRRGSHPPRPRESAHTDRSGDGSGRAGAGRVGFGPCTIS